MAISRRNLLQTALVAGSGAALAGTLQIEAQTSPSAGHGSIASNAAQVIATANSSIADTQYGKVRGFARRGIHIFRGIPYGASTAGRNRFMLAQKPAPWAGIRSALYYEQVSPYAPRSGWQNDENAFLFQWNDGQPGEDMLRINVWTPSLNDGRKRPVMFWIHGGGFTSGSGQELAAYEGENLCHRGDVVVVTMNHRLNVLGFLNLAEAGGEKYAHSPNVGMTDLVLALQWVRDNIANFGGDANNVMIFGQSGGGSKVSMLMAMPSAKGLFHKACVMSGSILKANTPAQSAEHAAAVLKQLKLSKSNLDEIQTMPYERLMEASAAVSRATPRAANPAALPGPNFEAGMAGLGYAPTADNLDIPVRWDGTAPPESAGVPLLVGNVLNEFNTGMDKPDCFSMTHADLLAKLLPIYGQEKSMRVAQAFTAGHPKANPFQLWTIIAASNVRHASIQQAKMRVAQTGAPTYLYWFQWQTPVLDGRPLAFHCADITFAFDNADVCESMTGNGPRAKKLSSRMGQAWINFARSGNPNHADLPHWAPVTATALPTMIFDDVCVVKDSPDGPELASLKL